MSWNLCRRISSNLYQDEIEENETLITILVGYVSFILIFILGTSDKHFIYHFNIPLLFSPYMMAFLISDLVTFLIFFMMDIQLGSECNGLSKEVTSRLTILRN